MAAKITIGETPGHIYYGNDSNCAADAAADAGIFPAAAHPPNAAFGDARNSDKSFGYYYSGDYNNVQPEQHHSSLNWLTLIRLSRQSSKFSWLALLCK
jgi:hypothetical protein